MTSVPIRDGTLHVEVRGRGPVLLLVHGFPLDHTMWRGQLDALATSHTVVAPDLRGFGRSSAVTGLLTMGQIADDLAELLDALDMPDPVWFCGLSMGGYVAWQFWLRHTAKLAGLILCDTRAAADSVEVARGRQLMAQQVVVTGSSLLLPAMSDRLFAPQTKADQPDLVATVEQVILKTSPESIAAAQRGMAERPDMQSQLPQVNVPTLALCGQYDVITPPAEMQDMVARMSRARYVEIADAGHMAPFEQPDAVNQCLREFLAQG